MMSAGTDLIVRYYDAIERRDLEAVLAMTHSQIHFHDFLDSGEIDGLVAARDFYRRMFEFAPDLDLITVGPSRAEGCGPSFNPRSTRPRAICGRTPAKRRSTPWWTD
jgi:hypothetical protein